MLEWKQDNDTSWSLYKDGNDFVGYVYYKDGKYNGSFRSLDGRGIDLKNFAENEHEAMKTILQNYLLKQPKSWWMR